MKKISLGCLVVTLVITIHSFENSKTKQKSSTLCKWAVFKTFGSDERSFSDYDLIDYQPLMVCPASGEVCYFKVCDQDWDGDVDEDDFDAKASSLDTDMDGCINDNQSEGITPDYEERIPW